MLLEAIKEILKPFCWVDDVDRFSDPVQVGMETRKVSLDCSEASPESTWEIVKPIQIGADHVLNQYNAGSETRDMLYDCSDMTFDLSWEIPKPFRAGIDDVWNPLLVGAHSNLSNPFHDVTETRKSFFDRSCISRELTWEILKPFPADAQPFRADTSNFFNQFRVVANEKEDEDCQKSAGNGFKDKGRAENRSKASEGRHKASERLHKASEDQHKASEEQRDASGNRRVERKQRHPRDRYAWNARNSRNARDTRDARNARDSWDTRCAWNARSASHLVENQW
ncbi:hypothetical protein CF326_g831 [Tilletia indica]|uniref:Uncharacterized protein n=1 Tax=Tilletia indica TaxID=43049 RepID=A0A177TED6_9BASI|nr:hypothetical protein CF326_g831 [Tilletia indica]KAE8257232.1 hypothetical protein A4X13_0g2494 [Tilletia indica]